MSSRSPRLPAYAAPAKAAAARVGDLNKSKTHRASTGFNDETYHFSETSVGCGRACRWPFCNPSWTMSSISWRAAASCLRVATPSSSPPKNASSTDAFSRLASRTSSPSASRQSSSLSRAWSSSSPSSSESSSLSTTIEGSNCLPNAAPMTASSKR